MARTHMDDHHAIVYTGRTLAEGGVPDTVAHPSVDVLHMVTDRFAIADARELKAAAMVRPVSGTHRTFVVVAQAFTEEAQNALLKLFEEPPSTAQFHVVVPRIELLLPTLRSRIMVAPSAASADIGTAAFGTFSTQSYADRIAWIATLAKEKDTATMEEIMAGAEQYAADHVTTHPALLSRVVRLRDYFGYSGASRKMLLESLALALPEVDGTQS